MLAKGLERWRVNYYRESIHQCLLRLEEGHPGRGRHHYDLLASEHGQRGSVTYTFAAAAKPPDPCHPSKPMDSGVEHSKNPAKAVLVSIVEPIRNSATYQLE